MRRLVWMIGFWAVWPGCGGEMTDQEMYEALPAYLVPPMGSQGPLPDCGDIVPREGDVIVRLVDPSGRHLILVIRDGEPLCIDEFSHWMGGEDSDPDPDAETETEPGTDPEGDKQPEANGRPRGKPTPKDDVLGPRPIPWVEDGSE